jgi:hypothetical protein
MRFQGYILNEGRSKSITEDQAVDGIRKDCKMMLAAIKKKTGLFRGVYAESNQFLKVQPSKFNRESANTSNLYTLVIDNHPKWKKYPKRGKSIICTTHDGNASAYGDVFYVFPKDGSSYGICPNSDMWISFYKSGIDELDYDFNHAVLNFAKKLGVDTKPLYGTNYRDLVMMLTEMDKEIMVQDVIVKYNLKFAKSKYDNDMLKLLQEILDPVRNGFKVINNPNQLPPRDGGLEIWTSGDCYMVGQNWIESDGNTI